MMFLSALLVLGWLKVLDLVSRSSSDDALGGFLWRLVPLPWCL